MPCASSTNIAFALALGGTFQTASCSQCQPVLVEMTSMLFVAGHLSWVASKGEFPSLVCAPSPGRPHPHLQALDMLAGSGLDYNGWQADVRTAEDHYVKHPRLFNEFLEHMQVKQHVYVGDRLHPRLQALWTSCWDQGLPMPSQVEGKGG